jgi:hypothetical protein
MPSPFHVAGSQPQKQAKYAPLFIDRAFTGLYTQRNPLHDPSDLVTAKFYGGRPDALWMGSNVELTNNLTLKRRPGLIEFSTFNYPSVPLRTFAFELTNGTIQVLVDTGSTGSLAITSVDNASGSTTVYNGTFPNGGSNAYVGLTVQIAGFVTNPGNNGTFVVTASTTTTLTVASSQGIAETHAATAISAGGVYYDEQNGTAILLWSKLPGAGQSYFVAVGGILYVGDGVSNWIYTPGGANGTVWGFGIPAPTVAPTVTITESGSAASGWIASTDFSTMGLVYDTVTGDVFQLQSVNASGTNSTQSGMSANGQPAWNQTPGGTTTDNTITWENRGPIVTWQPLTTYNNSTIGGTFAAPCIIYDPKTETCYVQSTSAASGVSGKTLPNFNPGLGQHTVDGSCVWIVVGSTDLQPWQANHVYGLQHNQNSLNACVELSGLQSGLPTTESGQILYFQDAGSGGTSGSGYTPWGTAAVPANTTIDDGDLIWLSLGSYTWVSGTPYTAWTANGAVFSVVLDTFGNFQVCVQTGVSGGSTPSWTIGGYGTKTTDGTVVWVNVGIAQTWAASTKWYLPPAGFAPPTSSQPYGGASVIDTNVVRDVEFAINSGISGSSEPTWPTGTPGYVDDNGSSFSLSSVSVSGGTATYHGTGLSTLAGKELIIAGFTNAGNNGYFVPLTATGTTFTVATTSQVNESASATASTGLIWFNEGPYSANSLAWQFGFAYSYSYKSRSLLDYYSVDVPGTSAPPIPPGLLAPLPAPTGSLTGDVSSAAPVTQITGSNTGAVITIQGPLSTDPAVDTIVIWRSADSASGGGSMFELTEIPNVQGTAPGTLKGNWSFQDFLPSIPTTINGVQYPGLNELIDAPVDGVFNPPPTGFLPMVYNFGRIWGSVGAVVYFSGGPDTIALGSGNPSATFNTADNFPYLATVIRLVKTSQGLIVFLTDGIDMLLGGPATGTFYDVSLAPGIGLGNYNGLDVYMGEIFFFSSDNQLMLLSPSLNASSFGFPLGDQFANIPSSGVSDATWTASTAYLAVLQAGIDNALFVANGSTGWYRCNPHQVPGAGQGPQPVWSPFAAITGGCKMVYTTEVSPGIKKLLVGSTTPNEPILERSLTTFTDNGTEYDAFFVMGSLVLAYPGEIALLKFIELDASGVSFQPTISYLLDEISGTFTAFTAPPVFDPPTQYGTTVTPLSYSPNRYYFLGNASLARCRHMQIMVDLGTTSNGDEIYNLTINGRIMIET